MNLKMNWRHCCTQTKIKILKILEESRMKKICTFILTAILLLTLAACTSDDGDDYNGGIGMGTSFSRSGMTNELFSELVANGEIPHDVVSLSFTGNNDISDISPIVSLTQITTLMINNSQIEDISPLASLYNLTSLTLRSWQISDISPLSSLTSLTTLTLEGSGIHDISPLSPLTNLSSLSLNRVEVNDISPLTSLVNLTVLNLSNSRLGSTQVYVGYAAGAVHNRLVEAHGDEAVTAVLNALHRDNFFDGEERERLINTYGAAVIDAISMYILAGEIFYVGYEIQAADFSPLAELTNLTSLNLSSTGMRDIGPLANLTNLTTLDLSRNTSLGDISPLAGLSNLHTLSIGGLVSIRSIGSFATWHRHTIGAPNHAPITDIRPLENLTGLRNLTVLATQISDISPLRSLSGLTTLNLSYNHISNVGPLMDMFSLTTLNLNYNNISDISPLRDLSNLTRLDLYNNRISDVASLAALLNLQTLDLESNEIRDARPLHDLELRNLNVSRNPLNDVQVEELNTVFTTALETFER